MKLCIECYKEMWTDASQMVSISKEKEKCKKCGKKEYLIEKDCQVMLVFDDFVNPFEKKKV